MTRTVFVTLVDTSCAECHMQFSVPKNFWDNGWNYGGILYCPRGHKMSFGTGRTEQLEREAVRLRARLDQAEAGRSAAQRRVTAMKGVVTKTKKRIAAGKCVRCTEEFPDLATHMAEAHPDYAPESDA